MSKKTISLLFVGAIFGFCIALFGGCSPTQNVHFGGEEYIGDLPHNVRYHENGMPMVVTTSTESDGRIMLAYISTEGLLILQAYDCQAFEVWCTDYSMTGRVMWNIPTYGPIIEGVEYTDEQYKAEFCMDQNTWERKYAKLYKGEILEDEKDIAEQASQFAKVEITFGPAYSWSQIYKANCVHPGYLNIYSTAEDMLYFWQEVDNIRYGYLPTYDAAGNLITDTITNTLP